MNWQADFEKEVDNKSTCAYGFTDNAIDWLKVFSHSLAQMQKIYSNGGCSTANYLECVGFHKEVI